MLQFSRIVEELFESTVVLDCVFGILVEHNLVTECLVVDKDDFGASFATSDRVAAILQIHARWLDSALFKAEDFSIAQDCKLDIDS